MLALFRLFIVRRLAQEPLRALMTTAGIALGVAVIVAIRLANASSVQGFSAAIDAVAGRASLEIAGPGVGIDEDRVRDLIWLREFGTVSPVMEGEAVARLGDDRRETMRVLGIDILRDRAIRDYRLTGSRGNPAPQDLLALLVAPDSVVLSEAFARRSGLDVGETVELAIGDGVRPFTIRGLLADEGPARVLDGNFVLMDIAAAQWALGRLGRVDRLDVRLDERWRVDEAERVVGARLPPGLTVQRPAQRGAQVERMLAAFHFNLTALSYVALLVGLFLVYNTVAVSVITRRQEIGILRALGAGRRTVMAFFVAEGMFLALAGCLVGVGLGQALAIAAVRLTSTTVTTLYVAAAAAVGSVGAMDVLMACGVAVPVALAASAGPALEAARLSPLAAIRQTDWADTRERGPWRALAVAVALFGSGAALSQLGPVNGLPVFGFAAAVALVLGGAALVSPVLTLFGRLGGGPLTHVFQVAGRLAHANLAGSVPRLTVSVAALVVSLSMMVAIAVMVGSFRETVIYWVGQTLQADLYVSAGRRSVGIDSTIAPEVEAAVRSHPAVAAVDRFRSLSVPYGGGLIIVGAGEFDVLLEHATLVFKAPDAGRHAMREAIGRDAVIVSEPFSLKYGAGVGDRVRLPTPAGPVPFEVAAIYYDYSSDRGLAVMDRSTFVRHFGDQRPTSLTVYLREGADANRVRADLVDELGARHRFFVNTNASLRGEVLRIFDSTFAITYALEAVAILVAILGVAGTLVTLVLERRRDLSVLRLVGASRMQVRRVVVIEAVLLGVVSQMLGLLVGLGLSLILIYVINVQSFGWTIQFHLPAAFLTQASLAIVVATALAGIYPARLATRLNPLDQVVDE